MREFEWLISLYTLNRDIGELEEAIGKLLSLYTCERSKAKKPPKEKWRHHEHLRTKKRYKIGGKLKMRGQPLDNVLHLQIQALPISQPTKALSNPSEQAISSFQK